MRIKLDQGAFEPLRGHSNDAGLDLRTPYGVLVEAGGSEIIDTGVHVEIPIGYVGFLKSKSGLNVKNSITNEGVIDAEYTGSIVAKLYNNGDEDVYLRKGDKITQLVILPVYIPDTLEYVDTIGELYDGNTARGENGFGSTGR
jgi:dUTP pyrophosphatase